MDAAFQSFMKLPSWPSGISSPMTTTKTINQPFTPSLIETFDIPAPFQFPLRVWPLDVMTASRSAISHRTSTFGKVANIVERPQTVVSRQSPTAWPQKNGRYRPLWRFAELRDRLAFHKRAGSSAQSGAHVSQSGTMDQRP
jgi:hypothetical protein